MSAFPKVYTVNGPSSTTSTSLPSWLTIKPRSTKSAHSNARKRVKTQHQLGQLELIQEFSFPESSIKIKTTADGHHAIGTGRYKPMMKVWDLDQLSEKFQRVTDAENVDFVILSDNWTKTLHLQADRSLALHTQGGLHHSLRLPTYGRSLAYHPPSTDALVGCTGTDIYRFNLEEGRYMTPLRVAQHWTDDREGQVEGVNVIDVNPRHGLWSFGLDGGGGVIEFWDPRSRSALTRLVLPTDTLLPIQNNIDAEKIITQIQPKLSITALASHPTDGLSMAVGTSSGHTLLYDLRSPTPFAVKDQGYGEGIRTVDWIRGGGAQEDGGRVVSADSKVIKIWSKDEPSTNLLSLHPPSPLNHLHPVPNSGLIFVATTASPLSSYYIPEIGPAPRWASFLDSVTEELADDQTGVGKGAYADYKFVDKAELDTLALTHLVGTPALKPYMHGYFLSLKLYTTARLIANPNSYQDYRDKIISERLASKAESRIRARKDQPKVNKALAERLRKADERDQAAERRKREKMGLAVTDGDGEGEVAGNGVMQDERFRKIFEDPEFEVDEESREFALLNPATANNNARRKTAVEDEDDESEGSSSGPGESEDDDEDELEDVDEDDDASDDSDDGDLRQYDPRTQKGTTRLPSKSGSGPSRTPRLITPTSRPTNAPTFGQRLSQSSSSTSRGKSRANIQDDENVLAMKRGVDGGMEMSFIPSGSGSKEGGGERKAKSKIEKFGAGLEKGREEDEEGVGERQRGGRTKRREVGRSASKNTFRRR